MRLYLHCLVLLCACVIVNGVCSDGQFMSLSGCIACPAKTISVQTSTGVEIKHNFWINLNFDTFPVPQNVNVSHS